jgi:zinc protease
MRDARVAAPAVGRVYLAPARRPGAQAEAAALAVLEAALGAIEGSWLARALTGPGGVATEVGASYAAIGVDPQTFGVVAALAPGRSPAELEAALDAAVADFLAQGPDREGVARAKAMLADALADRGARLDVARSWGMALATGLSVEDIVAWPDAIAAVEPQDVARAAAAVLRSEASVMGRLLPAAPTEPPQGEVSVEAVR